MIVKNAGMNFFCARVRMIDIYLVWTKIKKGRHWFGLSESQKGKHGFGLHKRSKIFYVHFMLKSLKSAEIDEYVLIHILTYSILWIHASQDTQVYIWDTSHIYKNANILCVYMYVFNYICVCFFNYIHEFTCVCVYVCAYLCFQWKSLTEWNNKHL